MTCFTRIERFFKSVDRIVGALAGGALLVIMVVLFVNALGRYVVGISFIGGEELARYLMVWLTFLGSYLLVRNGGHVSIDLAMHTFPPRFQRFLKLAINLFGAIVLGYVAWFASEFAMQILASGQMSSSLPIRKGWLYMSLPVSASLMAAAFLWNAVGGGPGESEAFDSSFRDGSGVGDTGVEG